MAFFGEDDEEAQVHKTWISRVMACVTTASYVVLINRQPDSTIVPTRGIRQRNPLSPYLYLICTESLSCLLNEAELRAKIKWVKVARVSPSINHIFFADNSLFFCRTTNFE